jgi:hypothetical protein
MQFVELVDRPANDPLHVAILQLNSKDDLLRHTQVNLGVCDSKLFEEEEALSGWGICTA